MTFQSLVLDLREVKDQHFKGAIGEILAALYLARYDIMCASFAGDTLVPYLYTTMATKFDSRAKPSWLTRDQAKYLNRNMRYGPRRWDLIGLRQGRMVRKTRLPYVIEVKFRMHGKSLSKNRMPTRDEIRSAKHARFVPLLVIVTALENWSFQISCLRLNSSGRLPLHPPSHSFGL